MRNMVQRYRLAIFTFLAVFVAIMGVGMVGARVLIAHVTASHIQLQAEANRFRAEGAARMLEQYIAAGASHEEAISRFQSATAGTGREKGFLCLVNQDGLLLSHPDPSRVGTSGAAMKVEDLSRDTATTWLAVLRRQRPMPGLLHTGAAGQEDVIYGAPVTGTTWYASAHVSRSVVDAEVDALARNITIAEVIVGALTALVASVLARAVSRRYERRMEAVNEELEAQVVARTRELRETLEALQLAHERLVRGEKMNLLGELMSGIAHEIRSPLSSILSGCHVLAHHGLDEKVAKTTALMREATDRLSSIVDNMLMFARNAPPARATVELNRTCERAVDLISSDLRNEGIELKQDYDPLVPRLELDVQQVQQVLLNLLNNARQALSGWDGERWIRLSTRANHEAVRVEVADSGPGIPAAERASVFQPFFTTKQTGTGLGLSLCRRFLEAHGARLDLLDAPVGARFQLTFPRSACETMVAMPHPE